jgi:hypothetical protein
VADWNPEANDIFLKALDLHAPGQRRTYLDRACGHNTGLRSQVEALLSTSERAGSFLEHPAVEQTSAGAIRPSRLLVEARAFPVDLRETSVEQPRAGSDASPLEFLDPSRQSGSLGRLGHYEVLEIVGRGGMGVVLRAFDEKLHRVVAIKAMAAQLASGPSIFI